MSKYNKRVCIVNINDIEIDNGTGEKETFKKGDRVMRTTISFAEKMISTGNWAYTSKSKLKSFINKQVKLMKNERTLGFIQNITGETFNEFRSGGKTYVSVPTFKNTNKTSTKVVVVRNTIKEITSVERWPESKNNVTSEGRAVKHYILDTKRVRVPMSPKNIVKEPVLKHTGNKILVVNF